jgi:protein-tyrosine-phosphatase
MERSCVTLAMTRAHKDEILRRYPEFSSRVFTLADFVSKVRPDGGDGALTGDIEDPYGLGPSEYKKCAENLRGLTARLSAYFTRSF